jgi:Putative prokaryotic signal transducing protein
MATESESGDGPQLERTYREMADEELQRIAAQRASLTDLAVSKLQQEFVRRGLDLDAPAVSETVELEQRELVSIRRFRDLPEALLAKGGLESAGIECFLVDDNMVRLDWFYSNLVGGVKLAVDAVDAEAAIAILDQPIPESFEVEGVGEYAQPRCPVCNSLDVSCDELNRKIAYSSAYLGVPLPIHSREWNCHSCKHVWSQNSASESS